MGGSLRSSSWLLLLTLASVAPSTGCWCKDCAYLTISLPEPDWTAEDGLVVAVSQQGSEAELARCTWTKTPFKLQQAGTWTCTQGDRTTTEPNAAKLYFDVENVDSTCTITVTDSQGSRSLTREPEGDSSGDASPAGCACDDSIVALTSADLAPAG